jgi:hypothetical protein
MQIHENCSVFFHVNRKMNPKTHLKTQKTSNTKNNPEQKEQKEWHIHSHKNSLKFMEISNLYVHL